jgi:hypothetical protein
MSYPMLSVLDAAASRMFPILERIPHEAVCSSEYQASKQHWPMEPVRFARSDQFSIGTERRSRRKRTGEKCRFV